MIRAQRLLLIIVLPIIALFLYFSYSDWTWNQSFTWQQAAPRVLIGWVNQTPQGRTISGMTTSGITTRDFDNGVWFAVVVPLCLVTAAVYLLLGGLHRARIERGLCANCGYDLHGNKTTTTRCPECGAGVQRAR